MALCLPQVLRKPSAYNPLGWLYKLQLFVAKCCGHVLFVGSKVNRRGVLQTLLYQFAEIHHLHLV